MAAQVAPHPGNEASKSSPKKTKNLLILAVVFLVVVVGIGIGASGVLNPAVIPASVVTARLSGVTAASFDSGARTAFQETVADTVSTADTPVQSSDVVIISVTDVAAVSAMASTTRHDRATSNAGGVQIDFEIKSIENLEETETILVEKVNSGEFATRLKENAITFGAPQLSEVEVLSIEVVELEDDNSNIPPPSTAVPESPLVIQNYECGSGSPVTVPSSMTVTVTRSLPEKVCVLNSSSGPVARSYDKASWEVIRDVGVTFDCNATHCQFNTPDLQELKLEEHSPPKQLSATELSAKFLTQATFGPRLEEIMELSATNDFSSWIQNQIQLPASSHRAFFRERVGPRVLQSSTVGRVRTACEAGSRWHRYSFTEQDIGKALDVHAKGTYFELRVDGVVRLHLRNVTEVGLNATLAPFAICDVDESASSPTKAVTLAQDCDLDTFEIPNPLLEFFEEPPRLINNHTELEELNPPILNVKLNLNAIADCEALPVTETQFVKTPSGTYYMFDPRLKLARNTLENPHIGHMRAGACHNVQRNPFNMDSCIVTQDSCRVTRYSSADLHLNETTIRAFYTVGGKFVYSIDGLKTNDLDSPCETTTSRWLIHSTACNASSNGLLDPETNTTLVGALSSTDDPNTLLRDIVLPDGSSCRNDNAPAGLKLEIETESGTKCFEHVHPHLHNVYDFSQWSLFSAHPGNRPAIENGKQNPISTVAASDGSTVLVFPSWHPQDRWDSKERYFPLLGRLGDVVDYQDLPSSVQSVSVSEHFGAQEEVIESADVGEVACGSAGEEMSSTSAGSRFGIAITSNDDVSRLGPFDQFTDRTHPKTMVWTQMALYAPDQLRQRMAWALSQIFVVSETSVSLSERNEAYTNYYDIFVRNALGNYRDVMREVSYSPMMGRMLTFEGSRSYSYSAARSSIPSFPDENYAREIMQLFTIGLWELNPDGTRKLDAQGNPISTYDNNDITTFAKAWTGFKRSPGRGNIENTGITLGSNYVDPMYIRGDYRDPFPKQGLREKYIGDGFPLCTDLPSRSFLRKGASYRYLGPSGIPELHERIARKDRPVLRMNLNTSSPLFQKLCNSDPSSKECRFKSVVTLTEELPCHGVECDLDTVRLVKLPVRSPYCPPEFRYEDHEGEEDQGDVCRHFISDQVRCPAGCEFNNTATDPPQCFQNGTVNTDAPKPCRLAGDEVPGAFFEYVRRPCVDLAFFENGKKIQMSGAQRAMCANPDASVASNTCCYASWDASYSTCHYAGEQVSYDTGVQLCEKHFPGKNYEICDFQYARKKCHVEWDNYFWTNSPCKIQVQVASDGKVSIVHNVSQTPRSSKNTVEEMSGLVSRSNNNWFRVNWEGEPPTVDGNQCASGACETLAASSAQEAQCLCNTTVVNTVAFSALPTRGQVLNELSIGAMEPEAHGGGGLTLRSGESSEEVLVYSKDASAVFSDDSIFRVEVNGQHKFFRNMKSAVHIEGVTGKHFRNPPMFLRFQEITTRDAIHETEAVIDHLFHHPNTAPFLAKTFINRFVTSNPSTRYVSQVATAFRQGRFGDIGTGKYGDLAATIAAVLLDPEARSFVVEADPSFGKFREPLIKVLHLMRSLDFHSRNSSVPVLRDLDDKIGMMAHRAPSVFSFFQYDASANGPLRQASLFAPEATTLQGPQIMALINGLNTLIKSGLHYCYSGFGAYPSHRPVSCWRLQRYPMDYGTQHAMSQGWLAHRAREGMTPSEVVAELDLLMTGGRLPAEVKRTLAEEYELTNATLGDANALSVVQQLMLVTPEFNVFGVSKQSGTQRKISSANSNQNLTPLKAVIYVNLAGGIDSYNLLVPYSGCTGDDLFAQYQERRGMVALSKSELLTIDVPAGTQPCTKFGIHHKLTAIKELYDEDDALFMANLGPLIEPVSIPLDPKAKLPAALFAHNTQTKASQTVRNDAVDIGVVGRIRDELFEQGKATASFTVSGTNHILNGEAGKSPIADAVHRTRGVEVLDKYPTTDRLRPLIVNLTSATVSSAFGETWSREVQYVLDRSEVLNQAIDSTQLNLTFAAEGSFAQQLEQACRIIKAHPVLNFDRAAFYTSIGGFDTHGDSHEILSEKMEEVNAAVLSMVAELKSQGAWNGVTVVFGSEFGRTMTGNGQGTDHGWGGNYFAVGGALKGGRVLGAYPEDLREGTSLDWGRGRIVPTTSWDAPWEAVAKWLGITSESALNRILPNRGNFPGNFGYGDMYDDQV